MVTGPRDPSGVLWKKTDLWFPGVMTNRQVCYFYYIISSLSFFNNHSLLVWRLILLWAVSNSLFTLPLWHLQVLFTVYLLSTAIIFTKLNIFFCCNILIRNESLYRCYVFFPAGIILRINKTFKWSNGTLFLNQNKLMTLTTIKKLLD